MTTEDDFQKALDANPEAWMTRLVFADWLQERGDERAEGYRALGRHGRHPARYASTPDWLPCWMWVYGWDEYNRRSPAALDPKWAAELDHNYPTRREAEDAAARAFLKLPLARRTALLAPPAEATT